MKQEFIVKLEGKQYEKGRKRLVVLLGCFIILLLIDMIYSPRSALSMLIPISFIWYRFKSVRAERTYLVDAICTVDVQETAIDLAIHSTQSKLCESHRISYADIRIFRIEEREVYIQFVDKNKRKHILRFFVMNDDVSYWQELTNGLNNINILNDY